MSQAYTRTSLFQVDRWKLFYNDFFFDHILWFILKITTCEYTIDWVTYAPSRKGSRRRRYFFISMNMMFYYSKLINYSELYIHFYDNCLSFCWVNHSYRFIILMTFVKCTRIFKWAPLNLQPFLKFDIKQILLQGKIDRCSWMDMIFLIDIFKFRTFCTIFTNRKIFYVSQNMFICKNFLCSRIWRCCRR